MLWSVLVALGARLELVDVALGDAVTPGPPDDQPLLINDLEHRALVPLLCVDETSHSPVAVLGNLLRCHHFSPLVHSQLPCVQPLQRAAADGPLAVKAV